MSSTNLDHPAGLYFYLGDISPVLLPVPQYLTSTRTSQLVMVNWFTKNGSIRDIASPRCLVSQKARMSSVLSHCDMEYPASGSFSSRMSHWPRKPFGSPRIS